MAIATGISTETGMSRETVAPSPAIQTRPCRPPGNACGRNRIRQSREAILQTILGSSRRSVQLAFGTSSLKDSLSAFRLAAPQEWCCLAAIRKALEDSGELSAALELRRHFPASPIRGRYQRTGIFGLRVGRRPHVVAVAKLAQCAVPKGDPRLDAAAGGAHSSFGLIRGVLQQTFQQLFPLGAMAVAIEFDVPIDGPGSRSSRRRES
jgi:hypothetical protein